MATARFKTVRKLESGVYHCRTRCVRQAYLCGVDERTGIDYNHRKSWVESRLKFLAAIFEIPIYSFAVMSNHLHVVLRTVPETAAGWSGAQVIEKAFALCPHKVSQVLGAGEPVEKLMAKADAHREFVEQWRSRLQDLSWFMRFLNEYIARRANREDGCKGRFWEGRFSCSLLADEGAILACMVYVDLNPVRAGIGEKPEDCRFTSIYNRIVARQSRERIQEQEKVQRNDAQLVEKLKRERKIAASDQWLCPLNEVCTGRNVPLGLGFENYVELVDFTGRGIRNGCGAIPLSLAPILDRLDLDQRNWLNTVNRFGSLYWRVAGRLEMLAEEARRVGQRWFRRSRDARNVYRERLLA